MDFKTFWIGLSELEREEFADACKTSVGHLRNVAYGKKCGEGLAIDIDRESSGKVTAESIRPDVDYAYLRGFSTVNPENSQKLKPDAHVECCSGDPRHGERRQPEQRSNPDRRDNEAD